MKFKYLLLLALIIPGIAAAQVSSNYWKYIGGVLSPNVINMTSLRIPYLASSTYPCVTVDGDGDFALGACLSSAGFIPYTGALHDVNLGSWGIFASSSLFYNSTTTNLFATNTNFINSTSTNFYTSRLTALTTLFTNLFVSGSSTLQNFTSQNATMTAATTTSSFYTPVLTALKALFTNATTTSLHVSGQTTMLGNVGVGTSSPSQKLDVWGNLNVATGSVPTLFVDTTIGHVGIGTATPNNELQVIGSITSDIKPTYRDYASTTGISAVNYFVEGMYMYVLTSTGITILDVSNPASITTKASIVIASPSGFTIASGRAYVYSSTYNTLGIYDVSNPYAITKLGETTQGLDMPYSIAVSGSYVFIGNYFANAGITSYDVSDASNIKYIGVNTAYSRISAMAVNGNYLYAGVAYSKTFYVFNITNPAAVTLVKNLNLTSGGDFSFIFSIVFSGRYAIVSSSYVNAMGAIDITDPPNAYFVASSSYQNGIGRPTIVGDNIISPYYSGMQVFSIRPETLFQYKGNFTGATVARQSYVYGDKLYGYQATTLEIWNMTAVRAPAADIGVLTADSGFFRNLVKIASDLFVNGSASIGQYLTVGKGLTTLDPNSLNILMGKVGIGNTPAEKLTVFGGNMEVVATTSVSSNYLTNGDFTSTSTWTGTGHFGFYNGAARLKGVYITNYTAGSLYQNSASAAIPFKGGRWYKLTYDVVGPKRGGIKDIQIVSGGTGYTVNDCIVVGGGDETISARAYAVTGGVVTGLQTINVGCAWGTGYSTSTNATTTGGTGTGLTVNVLSVTPITAIYVSTAFTDNPVQLDIEPGVGKVIYVKAKASDPTQFVIYGNGFVGSEITLDNLKLEELTGGNVIAHGLFTGGGTTGLKIMQNGNVGIGLTPSSTAKFEVLGVASTTGLTTINATITSATTTNFFTTVLQATTAIINTLTVINTITAGGSITSTSGGFYGILAVLTDYLTIDKTVTIDPPTGPISSEGGSGTGSCQTSMLDYYYQVYSYRTVAGTKFYSSTGLPITASITVDDSSINLEWDAVAGADGYRVKGDDISYTGYLDVTTNTATDYCGNFDAGGAVTPTSVITYTHLNHEDSGTYYGIFSNLPAKFYNSVTGTSIIASISGVGTHLLTGDTSYIVNNIRPSAGKDGWIKFTEDSVADRWVMGILHGDGKLYFGKGSESSHTNTMVLTDTYRVGISTTTPDAVLTTYMASSSTGVLASLVNEFSVGLRMFSNGITWLGGLVNHTKFEADGTMVMEGDATVFEDQQVNVSAIRFPPGISTNPTDTAYKGGYVPAFSPSATNTLYFTSQLSHSYKEGSTVELHIHLAYPTSGAGDSVWNNTCSWANIGDKFPGGVFNQVVTASPENTDEHKYVELASSIGSPTGKKISSVLVCSVSRAGANSADTFAGDIYLTSIDFHYEKDTVGSRTPIAK